MSKSVSYSVVPRKNPQEPEAGVRFYAQAQASGDVTVREMSERIQRTCTVTRADVAAVLTALEDVIVEALSAGEIVRLADLGTFQQGAYQFPSRTGVERHADGAVVQQGEQAA